MSHFVDDSLPKEMLDSMEQLRRNEELCDVELVVETECFRAHRVVLAASSMYFRWGRGGGGWWGGVCVCLSGGGGACLSMYMYMYIVHVQCTCVNSMYMYMYICVYPCVVIVPQLARITVCFSVGRCFVGRWQRAASGGW